MTSRRETFPRSARLRESREFRVLREQGQRVTGRYIIVNALARPTGPRRFGVITSRKFGPAVARNHARRWLREMFRHHQHQLKPNFSIIVVARQALARAHYSELQSELLRLFGAVGALSP